MPVFDYKCEHCGNVYEELVFSSSAPDSEIKCPACGKYESVKLMSAPSISGGSSSSPGISTGCGTGGFT